MRATQYGLLWSLLLAAGSAAAAPPILTDLVVEPSTVALGGGVQTITISVHAFDVDGNLNLKKVKVVKRPKDGIKEKTVLVDDGTSGDMVAGDGRFTAQVDIETGKTNRIFLMVKAKDIEKNKADPVGAIVSVVNEDVAPVVSELRVDPAVLEPQSGSRVVTISVKVRDPDADLKNVKLDLMDRPGGLNPVTALGKLLDDGTGGDVEAGDRVFTLRTGFDTIDTGPIPLRVTAKDLENNTVQIGFDLLVREDTDPPQITATVSPNPNDKGWHNANVTVIFTCVDMTTGIAECSAPATITTEGEDQEITGEAVDKAGNRATTSVTLNVDKTSPKLAVTVEEGAVLGTVVDDNLEGVTCNGQAAIVDDSAFICPTPLAADGEAVTVAAMDLAGNRSEASVQVPVTLTVTKSGNGSGTVTSDPTDINCGTDCFGNYDPGTMVTLTANPASGSTFTGWNGGDCSGTAPCALIIDASLTVTAVFTLLPPPSSPVPASPPPPANNSPVATNDAAITDEDMSVTITALANDTDPNGDSLSISNFTQANNGAVVNNGDGTFTYTPAGNFNGQDNFTYTISDGKGGTAVATVTITVNPIDDPPAAVIDATSNMGVPVTINVLSNDTDPDGDSLSITGFTAADNGTVVNNVDGTFTYTPDENFNGEDSFTYTVSDGQDETIGTVAIIEIPRGVVAFIGAGQRINEEFLSADSPLIGVALQGTWPEIEPEEGQFNWEYFDEQIALVEDAGTGKVVILKINAGGLSTPQWVFDADIQTYTFLDLNPFRAQEGSITIPLFWDPVYVEKKKNFIAAMGEHFADRPAVVVVGSPCVNAITGDWDSGVFTQEDADNLLAAGYTPELLIDACQETLDATMQAFPRHLVNMAVGIMPASLGSDAFDVARQVINFANTAYPGRFIAQRGSLHAKTPIPGPEVELFGWQFIFDNAPMVAAQMVWFATDDPDCRMNGGITPCDPATMLETAVTIGAVNYNTRWQEIYVRDLLNEELVDVINHAAVLLSPP